ncbi:hypothetical protein ACJX0J_026279 [Zea mays]
MTLLDHLLFYAVTDIHVFFTYKCVLAKICSFDPETKKNCTTVHYTIDILFL